MLQRLSFILFFWIFFLLDATYSYAQFEYHNEPFKTVILDIEQKTSYRFLYRESLIANLNISFEGKESDLFGALARQIGLSQLDLKVNSARKQVMIFKQRENENRTALITISGQVVDASTGERLPYATITWSEQDQARGIAGNSAGVFSINRSVNQELITLKASYIGYSSSVIELDLTRRKIWSDLTFRLIPRLFAGKEVIVEAPVYYSSIDTSLRGLVRMGTFSPLGESNAIRALQMLPSVATQTAINDGINIRGSGSDGFQLLLDGISIYNTSHLFGLLDSFNSDVLQNSGFYYDIAPARFAAPPGGTLNLTTKTGSLNQFNTTLGISNTAYKGTLEGPLGNGRGSWMISGRHSFINSVNWLNTDELVQWGLNVERPSSLDENLAVVDERIVQPKGFDALFYDLHGKFYLENASGNRFIISGYAGGDQTEQRADRYFQVSNANRFRDRFRQRVVATSNKWGNSAGSVTYQTSIQDIGFAHTLFGVSSYSTSFFKEDYQYRRLNPQSAQREFDIALLENESSLYEMKLEQTVDLVLPQTSWTFGSSYRYFMSDYEEQSLYRPPFTKRIDSHLFDFFAQMDLTHHDPINLNLGSRLHYFSAGNVIRFSPRVRLRLFPERSVSWSAGFSRNHQFLNKISLNDVISADFWMLATDEQPPLAVSYFTSGLYFNVSKSVYAQAEAYYKDFDNLRIHELSVKALSNTFRPTPIFFDNDATARGIEVLLQTRISRLVLTHAYTLSGMEIQNPLRNRTDAEILNTRETIRPEWDRKHQYSLTAWYPLHKHITVYAAWIYASGSPNDLAYISAREPARLDDYHRFDLTLDYTQPFERGKLSVSLSFYNLFDSQNPWYREYKTVFDSERMPVRIGAVPVNIYDLGFQPSFKILVAF